MKSKFLLACVMALSLWGGAPALAQTGDCVIKGNVNTRGERIYHVPGQRYYNDTVIWRKAKV